MAELVERSSQRAPHESAPTTTNCVFVDRSNCHPQCWLVGEHVDPRPIEQALVHTRQRYVPLNSSAGRLESTESLCALEVDDEVPPRKPLLAC